MKRSNPYRRWLALGCGAACAALLALPGSAQASKYDSDLAPIGDHLVAAVSPASSHADKSATSTAAKPSRSATPSWLSGSSGRRSSKHNR